MVKKLVKRKSRINKNIESKIPHSKPEVEQPNYPKLLCCLTHGGEVNYCNIRETEECPGTCNYVPRDRFFD